MQLPYQVYDMLSVIHNPQLRGAFLRGAGGTGKTYAIASMIKFENIPTNEYIFLGPTGKSVSVAEDKGIRGSTIHRFFKIQNSGNRDEIEKLIKRKHKNIHNYMLAMHAQLRNIKYIFIDEVSMIGSELFDWILEIINEAKKDQEWKLFLSGDFHQLPPVVVDSDNYKKLKAPRLQIKKMIENRELQPIDFVARYRSNNEDYNEFLFQLRNGQLLNGKEIVSKLRDFFNVYDDELPDQVKHNLTFLDYSNASVNAINEAIMHELPGGYFVSKAKIITDQCPAIDEQRQRIINDFQMDWELRVKIGSKILFRTNDFNDIYKNGEEGIIESIDPIKGFVTIRKLRTGERVAIGKHLYKSAEIDLADGYLLEVEQYPFSLGNARTYHKAQGDGFVWLHLNFDFMKHSSIKLQDKWQLLYVGLSRVMDPNHVWIDEESLKAFELNAYILRQINWERLGMEDESFNLKRIEYPRRDK